MKDALDMKWNVEVPARYSVVPWLIEYSAVFLNRYGVGKDGNTPFERLKGRCARTLGVAFGESVLWKRKPKGGAFGKFTCLWGDGMHLGIRGSPGELVVAGGPVGGVADENVAERAGA